MKKIKLTKDQFIEGNIVPAGTEIEITQENFKEGTTPVSKEQFIQSSLGDINYAILNSSNPVCRIEIKNPKVKKGFDGIVVESGNTLAEYMLDDTDLQFSVMSGLNTYLAYNPKTNWRLSLNL